MGERVYLDARRHGVVLVRPLGRALLLAFLGAIAFLGGWPISLVGAALLCTAAVGALAAVWSWDRTHVVLTDEKLFVVHGTLRRRAGRAAREGPDGRDRPVPPRAPPRLRHRGRGRPRDQLRRRPRGDARAPRPGLRRRLIGHFPNTRSLQYTGPLWLPTSSSSTAPASTTSRTSPSACRGTV